MFCLWVSEFGHKRFVGEEMDMSEMWSGTWQGYQCCKKYTGRRNKTNSIRKNINRAGTVRINACGDSRLRGRWSRKPIDLRQWVVHGLYISGKKELCEEYMGKYPVIFLSLKGIDGMAFEAARYRLIELIGVDRYTEKRRYTCWNRPAEVPSFLYNRKFRGIPRYIKRHWRANNAHSREDVDCRKWPREARECAKAPSFLFTRTTSQSPCLREILAAVAIIRGNSQSVFLLVPIRP